MLQNTNFIFNLLFLNKGIEIYNTENIVKYKRENKTLYFITFSLFIIKHKTIIIIII